jgi:hypothetical protein
MARRALGEARSRRRGPACGAGGSRTPGKGVAITITQRSPIRILVEAAKHYPCVKQAWVEYLGENPDPAIDRVEISVAAVWSRQMRLPGDPINVISPRL